MTHEVFISYSTHDSAIAKAIRNILETRQIHYRDIPPSHDDSNTDIGALSKDQVLVMIFSSHTNASSRVKREVANAFKSGATIIVFRIENVAPVDSLQHSLHTAHWLDAFSLPLERHFAELADRVRALMSEAQALPSHGSNSGDARDVLHWIVTTYGKPVATDLRRLEGLLRDLCGNQKRENFLLINAAKEGVPAELMSPVASLQPQELLLARLTLRLEENLLVTQNIARWAVESWALALGRITADELTTQQLNVPRAPTRVDPVTPSMKPVPPPVPPDPIIADEPEEEHSAVIVVPPVIDSGSVPNPYQGWSWSAFFLGWVWLFGHKLWRWGLASFLVCFCICVLSQWYVPFMHGDSTLYTWETNIGTALTYKTNSLLQTEFVTETFGIPVLEYAIVLLTFVPIGWFGNRLVSQRTGSRDFPSEMLRERRWRLWASRHSSWGRFCFAWKIR